MSQAGLLTVVDQEARGQNIRQRRLALGIKSVREFEKASKVSREAITAAESGAASQATYERLEAWLTRFEEEAGVEAPEGEGSGLVTFRLSGNFGVEVTVQGPIENVAELEEAVERLIRKVGEEPK